MEKMQNSGSLLGFSHGHDPVDLKQPRAGYNEFSQLSQKELRKKFTLVGNGSNFCVPLDSTITLGGIEENVLIPQLVSTNSIRQFKEWIGKPDNKVDDHIWEMPTQAWSGKYFDSKDMLTAEEASNIKKAGWIYLFNDSRKVASYTTAIEQYHGVFEVSLYHFNRLVIQPGAKLIITGRPTIVSINELELHHTGQLVTYAMCHVSIGKLHKIELQESIQN